MTLKKKILVLGGSYLQSDFVETALSMGHAVHVLDRNPDAFLSQNESITFSVVDISDLEGVDKYFIDNNCDIILSPITEIGNKISSLVAERHGLAYNSVDTVIATTDKRVMRERLSETLISEPRVFNLKSDLSYPKDLDFPFILKPSISSASRGVTLINTPEEFDEAVQRALPYCKDSSEILLEEFIDGDQYSIETISFSGKHFIVGIVREVLSGAPYFMERMDVVNTANVTSLMPVVEPYMMKLLDLLKVEYGPCHTEVKIKDGEVRLIEIASRSGLVRDRLLKVAQGIDYNRLILNSYLGQSQVNSDEIHLPHTNAMLGIMAYDEDVEAYKRAKKDGLVIDEHFNQKNPSAKATMLTDAIGYFFLRSDKLQDFDNYQVKL